MQLAMSRVEDTTNIEDDTPAGCNIQPIVDCNGSKM